jgi:hypothetical protein
MTDAPATPPASAPIPGGKGKIEKPEIVLILGFVTCGVYPLIWIWTRVKEINGYLGEQRINPMFVFPGCFCPPLLIYVMLLIAKALPDIQKKAGVEAKDEFLLHFLLLWLVSPVGMFMYQQKLNEVWSK